MLQKVKDVERAIVVIVAIEITLEIVVETAREIVLEMAAQIAVVQQVAQNVQDVDVEVVNHCSKLEI